MVSLDASGKRVAHYMGNDLVKAEEAYAKVFTDSSFVEVCLADLFHQRKCGTPAANAALIAANAAAVEDAEEKKSDNALALANEERKKLALQLAGAEERNKTLAAENARIKAGKKK